MMGQRIFNEDVEFLRPAPQDCLQIRDFEKLVGKKINTDRSAGDYLRKLDFEKIIPDRKSCNHNSSI